MERERLVARPVRSGQDRRSCDVDATVIERVEGT
jgi:hypothetical protein